MTSPTLDPAEAAIVAESFGVALEQVRRDHLISHILAALSESHRDTVLFFGGTALARTHLPDGRLSEDVDLIFPNGDRKSDRRNPRACPAPQPRSDQLGAATAAQALRVVSQAWAQASRSE